MKIYTKTGDEGKTGLFGGDRVSKASLRVEAYGTVDELNSALGWVAAAAADSAICADFVTIQSELFDLGAELATDPTHLGKLPGLRVDDRAIERLESRMDDGEGRLPALESFILPGGTELAARLHVARTVCRRAERIVVALDAADGVRPGILVYLNRLSDLLFVSARLANAEAGVADVAWRGRERR